MTTQPLQTHYNGRHFRSRLEARWAVYFDAIGVDYEYEPDGYEVATGVWYLPDMYLPQYGIHAEIKHEGGDFSKPYLFAAEHDILLLEGPPAEITYKLLYAGDMFDQEYRVQWLPVSISHAAWDHYRTFFFGGCFFDEVDQAAISAALSARFEK